jgi:hypothetical protein
MLILKAAESTERKARLNKPYPIKQDCFIILTSNQSCFLPNISGMNNFNSTFKDPAKIYRMNLPKEKTH